MKATHSDYALDNLVLLTEVGSDLHGVSVNEQDDIDQMGVYVETPNQALGIRSFEHDIARWHANGTAIPDGDRSGPGDTDSTLYSLRKFVRLASAGNPTVLMPLFAPESKVKALGTIGLVLRDQSHKFITKQAGYKFLGYCRGQYAQMIDKKSKHTNRPELIEQYGFDTKFAYHAMRLCIQGIEMIRYGSPQLPMSPDNARLIKDVRVGKYSKSEVTVWLDAMMDELEWTVDEFDGPAKMDPEELDCFLRNMHLIHWTERGLI